MGEQMASRSPDEAIDFRLPRAVQMEALCGGKSISGDAETVWSVGAQSGLSENDQF